MNKYSYHKYKLSSTDLSQKWQEASGENHNLGKIKIKDLDQLKEEVTKLLNNVPKVITQSLVNSMPKRFNECLKAKGLSTKY